MAEKREGSASRSNLDYFNYSVILVIILLCVHASYVFVAVQEESRIRLVVLKENGNKLSSSITTIFDEQANILLNDNSRNTEKIDSNLLRPLTFSQLSKYTDASAKYYRSQSLGMLQISDPVMNPVSGMSFIPLEIAAAGGDHDLNVIKSGINIKPLLAQLLSLMDNNIEFLIIDKNDNLITEQAIVKLNLSDTEKLRIDSFSILGKAIIHDDKAFYFAKKLQNYPYTVITGFSNEYLDRQLQLFLLPHIGLSITLLCILLLLIHSRYKVILSISGSAESIQSKENATLAHSAKDEVLDLVKALKFLREYK